MEILMMENGLMICMKDMVCFNIKMDKGTKASVRKIKQMDTLCIYGLMGIDMKDIGKITKNKEMAFRHGLMAVNMKMNMLMMREIIMEYFIGLMEEYIREIGKMEISMVKEILRKQQ